MAKTRTAYFCTDCGNETVGWQGKCPACGSWNTLVEQPKRKKSRRRRSPREPAADRGRGPEPVRLEDVGPGSTARWASGIPELDFALGGGVVPGSLLLVGGEPGVGKSTLLLQVAARLEAAGHASLYVSGEESAAQVRMRADRLVEDAAAVVFLGETELERVLAVARERKPSLLVIDSIQTVYTDDLEGAPGNVAQVRECASRLQRLAKEAGVAVVLVGHVTKGGAVAGPKTLEHIVDTVLYFEGATGTDHRVLRATKNRFGGVDEIGVFRMTATGLEPVANPSALFIGERETGVSGAAVVATLEGTRPLLVEVQALCSRTSYGAPQRVSTGYDRQRLALLLAVLERRAGMGFGELDVFLNVVGGVRLVEPATDLALIAALASSVADRALPADAVFIGEVGLGGELRPVGQLGRRLGEAARMGFDTAYVPARGADVDAELDTVPVSGVAELVGMLFS